MNRKVIIFGAGGHAGVIADIVSAQGDQLLGFLDDNPSKATLGKIDDYHKYPDVEFAIGIGSTDIRRRISHFDVQWYTGVHPSAVISPSAFIGEGTVVMPHAVINANSVVGQFCIINSGAIVEHNNVIENYSHISVGAKLGGNVYIKEGVFVGIGATIKNNLFVCAGATIGAGAVVVKDIEDSGVYIGIPAKRM